ncbi:hypothetical protein HMI54_014830 [Coelomomyces lativittatus]|nr:hypothetical protein HMI56_001778 [Coelomomyces lativittatus]KAJ1513643.1 hypothetical protein HMI54_014830 [Coelomomyces lativittatus]
MTMGNDMSSLFNHVIQCAAIQDAEVKKLIYLYLINYAKSLPDLATLAVNLLVKDSADLNPLVRAQAIRTMGYLPTLDITQCLCEVLRRGLKDVDAFVRKTSVVGVSKLFFHNSSLCIEEGFLILLREMLRTDNNTLVIGCILATLREISLYYTECKISISFEEANQWLSSLDKCSEWYQVYVIDSLITFVPNRYEEVEILADKVFPRLQHVNAAVCMSCIKILLYLLQFVSRPEFHQLLSQKISTALVTMMRKDPEIQYMTLQNIILIISTYPSISLNEVSVFFCLYNDPIYVKLAKLEVMVALANDTNAPQILSELKEYAMEIDVDFVKKAVKYIGRCAIQIPSVAQTCVEILNELIETHISYVLEEVIVVLRDIFRKYPNKYEYLIERISEYLDEIQDSEAKAAFIWILGQYCDRIQQACELLLGFTNDLALEPSNVQHALLTASVRLYLHQLPDSATLYKTVIELCTQTIENPDVRDSAFFYSRLIQHDFELARKAQLQTLPIISFETKQKIPKPLLKELSLCLGSLASVLHKSPETLIAQKPIQNLDDFQDSMDMLQTSFSNDTQKTTNQASPGKQSPITNKKSSQASSVLLDLDGTTSKMPPSTSPSLGLFTYSQRNDAAISHSVVSSSVQPKTSGFSSDVFQDLSNLETATTKHTVMPWNDASTTKSSASGLGPSPNLNLPLSQPYNSTISTTMKPSSFPISSNFMVPPATPPRKPSFSVSSQSFALPVTSTFFQSQTQPVPTSTLSTSSPSSSSFTSNTPSSFTIGSNATSSTGSTALTQQVNSNEFFQSKLHPVQANPPPSLPPPISSSHSSSPVFLPTASLSNSIQPITPPNQIQPVPPSPFPALSTYPISTTFTITRPPSSTNSTVPLTKTSTSSSATSTISATPTLTTGAATTFPAAPAFKPPIASTMPISSTQSRTYPTLLKRQDGGGLEIKGGFQTISSGLSLELLLVNTTMGVLTNLALKLKDNHLGLQVPSSFPCNSVLSNVPTPVSLILIHGYRDMEKRSLDIETAIRTNQGVYFFKVPLPFELHFLPHGPMFDVDSFFSQLNSKLSFERERQLLNTMESVKRKLELCNFQIVKSTQESGDPPSLSSFFGAHLITQVPVYISIKSNPMASLTSFDKLLIRVVSPAKFMLEDTLNFLEGP